MLDKKNPVYRTVRGYELIHQQAGKLTSALEDYLEMTYRLCVADNYARVGRLSELLNVKPSSVSKMIAKLAQYGYLKCDRYDIIQLTDLGWETGAFLMQRHETVEKFLRFVGSKNLLEETELIEHSLSPATVSNLHCLLRFFEKTPAILEKFQAYMASNNTE